MEEPKDASAGQTQTVPDFRRELTSLLNRHSREAGSDTPDFILAGYLLGCLENFDRCVAARERWYDIKKSPAELYAAGMPERVRKS
jgi:hypothetical protein